MQLLGWLCLEFEEMQGRSDGESRVRNAYGPMAQGGPPQKKIYTRFFKKMPKVEKIANFGCFAYGPTRPSLRLRKWKLSCWGY
jgi:hypothetical protein